ncbi:major facilitator superfamily domain-containing protein [Chytriomyces sp. MP71]|nr:major facilitator superfamily domain-containing protein [Chytriomyces sp. MP71]
MNKPAADTNGFLVSKSPVETNAHAPVTTEAGASSKHMAMDVDDGAVAANPHNTGPDAVKVPLTRAQFSLVFLGLVLSIMMAALDQTIVSTALKSVVADFGKQELVPWIGSAYLLTAAPFGILYGKMADLFGRKWVLVFALVVFEVGSLICGAAPNMEGLIIGRAVAGVGGGGIFSLVIIIISDIVSLQDRGKFQGMIGACFGLSSVIGPLIGGAFSDKVSWRWCFYINLPLGFVTVATVIVCLKFPPPEGTFMSKFAKIDFLGTFFVFAAIVCLVTPLQLGGSVWAWSSAGTIVTFILCAVFMAIFTFIELRVAQQPIVPAALFINPAIPAFLVVAFCVGAAFFSSVYYISLFFQVVNGDTATNAGVKTIPLVFGVVILSIASGITISKTGKFKVFFYIGPVFLIAGCTLISYLDINSYLVQKIFYLFIAGIGAGALIQTRILGLQANLPGHLIAVGTAVSQTCMTLGGAFGVSVSGTLFNNIISQNYPNYPALVTAIDTLRSKGLEANPNQVLALQGMILSSPFVPNAQQATADLITVFTQAFRDAYLSLLAYPILILLSTLFIKEVSMKRGAGASGGGH